MSAEEVQLLIDAWLKAKLLEDAGARTGASADALTHHHEKMVEQFGGALFFKLTDDPTAATPHVQAILDQLGVTLEPNQFAMATRLMMRAHFDLLRAIVARKERRWRPWLDVDPAEELVARVSQTRPVVIPADRPPAASQPSSVSHGRLSEVARAAISDLKRTRSFPPKRVADYENAVAVLTSALGRDPDLSEVTPDVAGRFMRELTRYPAHASKREQYRNLKTFKERIDAVESLGGEALGPVTINNKYLGPLRQIWRWRQPECSGLINPFTNLRAEMPRYADPSKSRRDFEDTEIIRFFSQPLFIGAAASSQAGLYKPGSIKVDDWRVWVPLICFFSGMRLNEACGLAVADIRRADGIEFFHVRDEVEGQSLKSAAARRKVPIHDQLVEVGFLRFVARQKAAHKVRLFEDLKQDAVGYFSGIPSKFFGRFIDRIENQDPEEPGTLVFHSTRHTVTTKLRSAGVRTDFSKEIIGHEQGEVHGGYGSYPLPAVREEVNKISYPGLDLSRVVRP